MATELEAPDAGEALRMALAAQPTVTALVGQRIGLTVTGSAPAIRYTLVPGGENIGGGASVAVLQVDCWGQGNAPDDGTADRIARRVCAVLPGMVGDYGQARVMGASADYPYRADDPTTNRPRAIVTVTMIVQPQPQGA